MLAVYTNIMFLVSILGILYITFLIILMVGISVKKRKTYVFDVIDDGQFLDPNTGSIIEKQNSKRLIHDVQKRGKPVDKIIERHVTTEVKPSLGATENVSEYEHDVKLIRKGKHGEVKHVEEVQTKNIVVSKPCGSVYQIPSPAKTMSPVRSPILQIGNQTYVQSLNPTTHHIELIPIQIPTGQLQPNKVTIL